MYDEQAWNAGVLGSQTDPYGLPSGKRLHSYGKSPCYQWVNQLFRLGHFQ